MRWTLLLVSLLAVAANAGTGPTDAKPPRASMDANGDGLVSRAEAGTHPRLSADFEKADTNKDGQLDTAEMDAHRERMRAEKRAQAEERWKAADTDGDGNLTRAEAEASMPRMAERFDALDANADGRISREEMHSHWVSRRKGP